MIYINSTAQTKAMCKFLHDNANILNSSLQWINNVFCLSRFKFYFCTYCIYKQILFFFSHFESNSANEIIPHEIY